MLKTTHNMPVLLVSANVMRWAEARDANVGANGFLAKPFALADLLHQVQQLVPARDA
jgi:CheY-like chemotaxis protein